MVGVKLGIKSEGSVPTDISVDKPFYKRIARRLSVAQQKRIGLGRKTDGGEIKGNEPSTKATKARRGQPQISLVDGYRPKTTVKFDSAGRSGGMVGRSMRRRAGGKLTKKHHFIGRGAYVEFSSDRLAAIWLPNEAEFIAQYLRRKGYVGWWGIDQETRDWIDAFYEVTVIAKMQTREKRKARGPRLLGG